MAFRPAFQGGTNLARGFMTSGLDEKSWPKLPGFLQGQ